MRGESAHSKRIGHYFFDLRYRIYLDQSRKYWKKVGLSCKLNIILTKTKDEQYDIVKKWIPLAELTGGSLHDFNNILA